NKQARKMALTHRFCGIEHQKNDLFTSYATGSLSQSDEGLAQVGGILSWLVERKAQHFLFECQKGAVGVDGRNAPFSGCGSEQPYRVKLDSFRMIGVHMVDGALCNRRDRRCCAFWQEHLIRLHGLDPPETRYGMDFLRFQAKEREIGE